MSTAHQPRRVLVVANETCGRQELCTAVRDRIEGDAEVLVVAPALNSRVRHYFSDRGGAIAAAEERLARSVEGLAATGLQTTGVVGDADPVLAIADALVEFRADEIVIATHPPERSNWLERDVVERARSQFDQPISHVIIGPT